MKVVLSDRAKNDLEDIKAYLVEEWGWKVFEEFYNKFDTTIKQIKNGIVTHQYYEDTQYRKVLITIHNTLIYYIEEKTIYIVTILNNYKDPNTNYNIVETYK